MRTLFLLFLFALSSQASAVEVYRFGKTLVAFVESDGFMVNKSCSSCQALSRAKEFKGKRPSSDLLIGGKNPEAVKCKSLMNGNVIIGTDRKGNEQSFCAFGDDSYLRL